jgi:methyltransferase (TIGR00027 family)
MSDGELAEVSKTAIGVALIRAMESQRPDRLFNDPFAMHFVAAAPEYLAERAQRRSESGDSSTSMGAALAAHVAVRTRFYDTYLLQACGQGCRQVVLLAAGLDARAYRLDFRDACGTEAGQQGPRGVRLFELDLPPVLAFKQRVLAGHTPTCERVAVPVDLSGEWREPLRQAGFDPSVPTAWLIEGLLIYLTRDQAVALLGTVNDLSAPGSQVSFEQSTTTKNVGAVEYFRQSGQLRDVTALWKGGLGEDAVPFFERRGWRASVADRKATAESYGRTDPGHNAGEFLIGTKVS